MRELRGNETDTPGLGNMGNTKAPWSHGSSPNRDEFRSQRVKIGAIPMWSNVLKGLTASAYHLIYHLVHFTPSPSLLQIV